MPGKVGEFDEDWRVGSLVCYFSCIRVFCVMYDGWVAWHVLCGLVQYVRRAMSNSEKLELIIVTKNRVLGSIFHLHLFYQSVNENIFIHISPSFSVFHFPQCFDTVGWMTGRHLSCNIQPVCSLWGPSLTWINSATVSQLNKKMESY